MAIELTLEKVNETTFVDNTKDPRASYTLDQLAAEKAELEKRLEYNAAVTAYMIENGAISESELQQSAHAPVQEALVNQQLEEEPEA